MTPDQSTGDTHTPEKVKVHLTVCGGFCRPFVGFKHYLFGTFKGEISLGGGAVGGTLHQPSIRGVGSKPAPT